MDGDAPSVCVIKTPKYINKMNSQHNQNMSHKSQLILIFLIVCFFSLVHVLNGLHLKSWLFI